MMQIDRVNKKTFEEMYQREFKMALKPDFFNDQSVEMSYHNFYLFSIIHMSE